MDYSIVVGAREHMLSAPPMVPDVGSDYYWLAAAEKEPETL